MYRAFFGFRDRPFDLTPNPRFLVLTDAHREALSNLEYGIESRRGITALIGEAGTGKTTLIRTALARQSDKVHCVYLHNPALTRSEFIEMLGARFQLSDRARVSKTVLLTELETKLRERHARGEATVLIVDEAQSLPLELLEEVRLLGNIETADAKLLSIVLAGQNELAARLNHDSLRQLKQRIALRCELRALTETETAAYLAGRIRAAGGIGAHVFTREAVMLIYRHSRGIPRAVSVIADNALLNAYAVQRKPITSEIVVEVCRDLDLHPPDGGDQTLQLMEREVAAPPLGQPEPAGVLTFETGDASSLDGRDLRAEFSPRGEGQTAETAADRGRASSEEAAARADAAGGTARDRKTSPRSGDDGPGMFSSVAGPRRRLFGFF